MEFVRSRKAHSTHSSASPSRPPQGKSRTETVPLDNVNRGSDSPKDAVPSHTHQDEEMEGEVQEVKPPPQPALIGTLNSQRSWFFVFLFIDDVIAAALFF